MHPETDPEMSDNYMNKNTKKTKPQVTSMNSVPRKEGISKYWIVVGVFLIIAMITAIYILL